MRFSRSEVRVIVREHLKKSLALLAMTAGMLLLNACGIDPPQQKVVVEGGDAARGRELIDRYGCGSCHDVPGIANAHGQVGPPLDGIAVRSYVGGILPNTPANMVAWICRPQAFAPGTAMPDLGIAEAAGRDIAAYLYTLR
jgi:cytochrome c